MKSLLTIGLMVALCACGKATRGYSSGLEKSPILVKEIIQNSTFGKVRLLIYSGTPDLSEVWGKVGTLEGDVLTTRYIANKDSYPVPEQEVRTTSATPVYAVSVEEGEIVFAAFADQETARGVANPVLLGPKRIFVTVMNYCSRYQFLGNSYLNSPIALEHTDGIAPNVDPKVLACDMVSDGEVICESFTKGTGGQPFSMTKDNYDFILKNDRAFHCVPGGDRFGPLHSYERRDEVKWLQLRVALDPKQNSFKVIHSGSKLDPKKNQEKIVHFKETELKFSLGN
jgi:hypothetical protein